MQLLQYEVLTCSSNLLYFTHIILKSELLSAIAFNAVNMPCRAPSMLKSTPLGTVRNAQREHLNGTESVRVSLCETFMSSVCIVLSPCSPNSVTSTAQCFSLISSSCHATSDGAKFTCSEANSSSRSNSSRAGPGGSLKAGGKTAGCKGGIGVSNWGCMRVKACFFTPSLSYNDMTCTACHMHC